MNSINNGSTKSESTTTELSIVMPCLNEAETLETCIVKAQTYLKNSHVNGEVIIADNGSTDGSQDIAKNLGAVVINVKEKGYGSALIGGIKNAQGRYIIMGDADDSYDFLNLQGFVDQLRNGYELVMGNRFKGGIKKGAMPPLHRYLGNPVLSFIGRLFFHNPASDFHCGLRGFNKKAIEKLGLTAPGMEFASEMVVKATLHKLKIIEVPTTLSPDGRTRKPHLRSWRDGWRHLRFLLLFSPRWLFLYPGMILSFLGISLLTVLSINPVSVFGITLDIHTQLYASFFSILGTQFISFAIFSRQYASSIGIIPDDSISKKFIHIFSIEKGILIGLLLFITGLFSSFYSVYLWSNAAFGDLNPQSFMRIVIPSGTAITVGLQIMFSSFFLGYLKIKQPD